jgi:hypothetical protein
VNLLFIVVRIMIYSYNNVRYLAQENIKLYVSNEKWGFWVYFLMCVYIYILCFGFDLNFEGV